MRRLRIGCASLIALLATAGQLAPCARGQEETAVSIRHKDPNHLRYRGILKGHNGQPETDPQTLTFTIREAKSAQSICWQETLVVRPDAEGNYVAMLGSTSPVGFAPELVRDHSVLWVMVDRAGFARTTSPVITTPQGIYQDCNLDGQGCQGLPGDTAISQLQQIASGGFILVRNYSNFWGTAAQIQNYASQASNLGVNVIWSFDDANFAAYAGSNGNFLLTYYTELAATCKCTTNQGFINYIVELVRNLPATWGYSIADEPVPTTGSRVKSLYTLIHKADPNHPAMVNATYDDATMPTLSNLQHNLDPFNFADVLGADYYPASTGAPISYVVPASKNAQTIANNYGKPSQFILQAFSWGQEQPNVCSGPCTFPTQSEMQTMLDDAAANMNPSILMWFDYWDTVKAGQWSNLIAAANPQH